MGAILELLTEELRDEITRRGTVVWLDRDGHYSDFAAALAKQAEEGAFPYPVIPFEGSYVELMMKLEAYGNGLDPDRILIHMPGHNERTLERTPVLELYSSGSRFRKALSTLIKEAAAGRVDPQLVDGFVAEEPLSLAAADAWLSEQLTTSSGIVAALRRMTVTAVVDDLLSGISHGNRPIEAGKDEPEIEVGGRCYRYRLLHTRRDTRIGGVLRHDTVRTA